MLQDLGDFSLSSFKVAIFTSLLNKVKHEIKVLSEKLHQKQSKGPYVLIGPNKQRLKKFQIPKCGPAETQKNGCCKETEAIKDYLII